MGIEPSKIGLYLGLPALLYIIGLVIFKATSASFFRIVSVVLMSLMAIFIMFVLVMGFLIGGLT